MSREILSNIKGIESYQAWKKKDFAVHSILISLMDDNFILEYHQYPTTHETWIVLKRKFEGTIVNKLK